MDLVRPPGGASGPLVNAIEPDMVLGKTVEDERGGRLGHIVDVGLYSHSRVKFLIVEDDKKRVPVRVAVDAIERVGADTVRLRPTA